MSRYALLILPSHNRVYAGAAPGLARAELAVLGGALPGGKIDQGSVGEALIGGVPYITFHAEGLTAEDAGLLGNLSSLYALFETEGDAGAELLRPVTLRRLDRYDDDLLTILKYPGKTNEQFTKLLLNVTLAASAFARDAARPEGARRLCVLDPLCGRGTTLNQAIMYGFDAHGTDIDGRDIETYAVFLRRWLKDKRLKHQADFSPVRRDRRVVARRLRAEFAASKDEYKAGDVQRVDVVEADTSRVGEFFKPESADLIVTDLPYGVQHGSHGTGTPQSGRPQSGRPQSGKPQSGKPQSGQQSLARSPLELLASAVPHWAAVLRPGGAMGISWNTMVVRREDAAAILAASGLDVRDEGPFRDFRHRVDQAITRDILVACK